MYDVAIIGTGCAGLSASIYTQRYNLKTIVFGQMPGGLITTTHMVENYPGLGRLSGMEMGDKFINHAKMLDVEIKYTEIKDIEKKDNIYYLYTSKDVFEAKTIIIATGSEHRKLNASGEEKLQNRGVSYCATCDGMFYKDKITCVIGGSDSAAKEALMLADICKKVYIIYRKNELRAEPINKDRVKANDKIEILTETEVEEFVGENKLEKLVFKNGKGELKMDGAFIAIGHIPNSAIAEKLGAKLNNKKEIIIDKNGSTNVEGLFVAGDVTNSDFKQAIVSACEGCYAARSVFEFLS